jgi:hypothetical protein
MSDVDRDCFPYVGMFWTFGRHPCPFI